MVDKAAEYGSVRAWATALLGLGLRIFQEQLGLALKLLGPTITYRLAPDVSDVNPQLFKNFMKVLCNANTSEGFRPSRDVSIPEIYLRFGTLGPPHRGPAPNNRPILAFFGGRDHGQIRKIILKHWKDKDCDVKVHEYLPKGRNYTKVMGQAEYCLCPSGFEVASPRIVEAIVICPCDNF
uniref:Exostosin GT47 domain-containing protein n=1 Tax=Quercus lobata TaxID=97700 RepID=A0A7N2R035_QUELO